MGKTNTELNISPSVRRLVIAQLSKVKFVSNKYEAEQILQFATKPIRMVKGTEIVVQGRRSLGMFIVVRGEIQVSVNGSKIYKYSPVSRFGERNLLTNDELCNVTCAVESRVAQVLYISRDEFRKVLSHQFATIPYYSGTITGNLEIGGHSRRGMERVVHFNGIRYGSANRWEPPVMATPDVESERAHDALLPGAACAQIVAGLMSIVRSGKADHPPSLFFRSAENNRLVFPDGGVQSEDCHFLNVTTPLRIFNNKNSTQEHVAAKLPVMVFIHGGAFVTGSGSLPIYNGKHLAVHGNLHGLPETVVVTINYRLGVLGFLAPPSGEFGVTPNLGLLDQICALQWVQANIAQFGGDPNNVTVFGESAGAMSISCLMSSPLRIHQGVPLFSRAIVQSGSASLAFDDTQATKSFVMFLKQLHRHVKGTIPSDAEIDPNGVGGIDQSPALSQFQQLKNAPLEAILAATKSAAYAAVFYPTDQGKHLRGRMMMFQPTVLSSYDEKVFEGVQPLTRIANGAANDVDLLIGFNRDEFGLFQFLGVGWKKLFKQVGENMTGFEALLVERLVEYIRDDPRWEVPDAGWEELCRSVVHKLRKSVNQEDVSDVRHEAEALFEKVYTAWVFGMPAIRLADAHCESMDLPLHPSLEFANEGNDVRKAKTFFYRLDYAGQISSLRTPHALDLPLMFGTWKDFKFFEAIFGKAHAKDSNQVSDEMMHAWVSFAALGIPSPAWSEYSSSCRSANVFGYHKNRFSKQVVLSGPEVWLKGIAEAKGVVEKPKKQLVSML